MRIEIVVNGEKIALDEGATLIVLARTLHLEETRGIAIALNDEIVSREKWPHQELKNSDTVLIITAAQGG